jgi:hypothetical protein
MNNFGVLFCFDAGTGEEVWQCTVGRVGKGSPVWADDKIYVSTVNGNFAIVKDDGNEAELIDTLSFETQQDAVVELFGSPAVADGRVVFFTTQEMVCLGRQDAKQQPIDVPRLPDEPRAAPNAPAALIQIRPCEVLVKPGEAVQFRVVAFDKEGRELGSASAKWSYRGVEGTVDGNGRYTATGPGGGVGSVTATSGELSAEARIRVVPELPIVEDFESYSEARLIPWWIGVSQAKHAIETIDGSKALKKIADNRGPVFNRSRVYITPPLKTGYTVQADVMGAQEGRRRGDVGLINARYRLELFGRVKRMRVMSWVPGPRFEKRLENFSWDPNRWYTVKFHVELEGDQAKLYAKVWPRDEAEPAAWTLEAIDPQPNLEGSAGIYAYSMAPVYYDNVRIYTP